jgi:hypothetical protein
VIARVQLRSHRVYHRDSQRGVVGSENSGQEAGMDREEAETKSDIGDIWLLGADLTGIFRP